MRQDERGNKVPATLGEYRALCVDLAGEANDAVRLLDKKIAMAPRGRNETVVDSDLDFRSILIPLLMRNNHSIKP